MRQHVEEISGSVDLATVITRRRWVKQAATGRVRNQGVKVLHAGNGEQAIGVAVEGSTATEDTAITIDSCKIGSVTELEAGAAVAINALVQSDASGRGITQTGSGIGMAIAETAAAAAGDIIQIRMVGPRAA